MSQSSSAFALKIIVGATLGIALAIGVNRFMSEDEKVTTVEKLSVEAKEPCQDKDIFINKTFPCTEEIEPRVQEFDESKKPIWLIVHHSCGSPPGFIIPFLKSRGYECVEAKVRSNHGRFPLIDFESTKNNLQRSLHRYKPENIHSLPAGFERTLATTFPSDRELYQSEEFIDLTLPKFSQIHGVIVLGGAMGAYDTRDHPFLVREKAFMRQVIRSDIPLLGICLGSQLLADCLGGAALQSPTKPEIGLVTLAMSSSVPRDSLLSQFSLPNQTSLLFNDTESSPYNPSSPMSTDSTSSTLSTASTSSISSALIQNTKLSPSAITSEVVVDGKVLLPAPIFISKNANINGLDTSINSPVVANSINPDLYTPSDSPSSATSTSTSDSSSNSSVSLSSPSIIVSETHKPTQFICIHGDMFFAPPGVDVIAWTHTLDSKLPSFSQVYPQAMRARMSLGLQFHPEASPQQFTIWTDNCIEVGEKCKYFNACGKDGLLEKQRRVNSKTETLLNNSNKFFIAWIEDVENRIKLLPQVHQYEDFVLQQAIEQQEKGHVLLGTKTIIRASDVMDVGVVGAVNVTDINSIDAAIDVAVNNVTADVAADVAADDVGNVNIENKLNSRDNTPNTKSIVVAASGRTNADTEENTNTNTNMLSNMHLGGAAVVPV